MSVIWSVAKYSITTRKRSVEDVQFGAGEAPLLIVASGNKKFDVPFAEAYLEAVDLKQRQVRMNLPEGMLEINAPMTAEEKQNQTGRNRN